MDNVAKGILAGTACGVWFIALIAGWVYMRFNVSAGDAFPSTMEAMMFLGIPFSMSLVFGLMTFGFLGESNKAEGKKNSPQEAG